MKRILLFILVILTASCNRTKTLKKEIIYNNCIKSFEIDRTNRIGMDGIIFTISLNNTLLDLFKNRKIKKYKPLHSIFSTYPYNYSRPEKFLNADSNSLQIIQGTTIFFGVNEMKFDSIEKEVLKDLVIEFSDSTDHTWRIRHCCDLKTVK